MNTFDKEENVSNITVGIGDLDGLEGKMKVLVQGIGLESLKELLSTFYFYRLSSYVNSKDYQKIEKLEGILDLISSIQK